MAVARILLAALFVPFCGAHVACGVEPSEPLPHWIGPPGADAIGCMAERSFELPAGVQTATLRFAADFCSAGVGINGHKVLQIESYCPTQIVDVTHAVRQGSNTMSLSVSNGVPDVHAVCFSLSFTIAGGRDAIPPVVSDASFGLSGKHPADGDKNPSVVDRGPVRPELWGVGRRDASISPLENYEQWQQSKAAGSEPTQKFYVPEGFEVSLLRTAAADEGSWIALGFDSQGRALVSREDQGFLRLSFDPEHQKVERVERVASDLKECRGLLYAYDRWYANANNSKGMYRFQIDAAGKIVDQKLLREFPGSVGHGRNDLALGKDGRIYSIHGDSVETPTTDVVDRTSPLDRQEPGAKPNRASVVSTDADGKSWEVFCTGLRNPYGIGVHPSGDLFTYDADNEFDMGTPWYRPTRIVQLRSGADYGYRITTDNRRPNYVDRCDNALPLIDVGRGSPTACMFGADLKFPQPYRDALYVLDWTYGRVLAVHMAPRGAGYRANLETFLQGRPLNVTDVAAGPDGAMYLITGGRKTQSALYRVAFTGTKTMAPAQSLHERQAAVFSEKRRAAYREFGLQASNLEAADPLARYDTRTEMEKLPVSSWSQLAVGMKPELWISAVRTGNSKLRQSVIENLAVRFYEPSHPAANLRNALLSVDLHDAALPEIRRSPELHAKILENLRRYWDEADSRPLIVSQYGTNHDLRRRLITLLAKLDAPQIVELAAKYLLTSNVQEDKLATLSALSTVKTGWTPETRRLYFTALRDARRFVGGQGMPGFLDQIKSDAVATLSDAEKRELAELLAPPKEIDEPLPPTRPIVKKWTLDELAKLTAAGDSDDPKLRGDPTRGAVVFREALCSRCHRAGLSGPAVGPDLTFVAARFSRRDILHSVLEPSAAVAEQYRNTEIVTDDGRTLVGRVVSEGDFRSEKLLINMDPLRPSRVTEVDKKQIAEHRALGTSPMPQGLLDGFTPAEVRDLLAFLERGP